AERAVGACERVPRGVVERVHEGLCCRSSRDMTTQTWQLDEPTLAHHLARIEEDGYTVLEGAIEPELVVALRDTIRRLERELDVKPRGTAAEGHATRRIYNLLAKDPVFQAMPLHRNVLPLVERLLDRG